MSPQIFQSFVCLHTTLFLVLLHESGGTLYRGVHYTGEYITQGVHYTGEYITQGVHYTGGYITQGGTVYSDLNSCTTSIEATLSLHTKVSKWVVKHCLGIFFCKRQCRVSVRTTHPKAGTNNHNNHNELAATNTLWNIILTS